MAWLLIKTDFIETIDYCIRAAPAAAPARRGFDWLLTLLFARCVSLLAPHRGGVVRFTWFNLMPWPYLPDDFREKNRSVWVDIDSRLFDPVKAHEVYNTYLDLLEYASTLGFDGIGCNEHHQC